MEWSDDDALPEDPRREYIDGRALATPAPDMDHQDISFTSPLAMSSSPTSSCTRWRRGGDKRRFTGMPALVVEVLSTNRGDDLFLKMNRFLHEDDPAATLDLGVATLTLQAGDVLPPA